MKSKKASRNSIFEPKRNETLMTQANNLQTEKDLLPVNYTSEESLPDKLKKNSFEESSLRFSPEQPGMSGDPFGTENLDFEQRGYNSKKARRKSFLHSDILLPSASKIIDHDMMDDMISKRK